MSKSLLTNLSATAILISGFIFPTIHPYTFSIGLFALSGALTNWIAIHMLFERVPLLYGSGVIPNRFEDFKAAIKTLMMEQFFNKANIESFISKEEETLVETIDINPLIDSFDFDRLFTNLQEAVASQFGPMLMMVGGISALDPLKEPFTAKTKSFLEEMSHTEEFKQNLLKTISSPSTQQPLQEQLESMIDTRLSELTPQLVKSIIQDMIQAHLGWLVVWGGFFGGLIGLAFSLFV